MALPKRRTPQPIQHRPVLAALKAKPCGRRRSAGLDRRCARAGYAGGTPGRRNAPPPNKETDICLATKSGHLCLSLTVKL